MILLQACLLVLLVAAGAEAAERRPNVLFIAVDDMNNDLECFGSSVVRSPHLDRLAQRGVRFERAYCQFPLCSPSRSSLLTGLRPNRTKVYDLKYHFRDGLPDVVTLPQHFKNHGYYAGRVGKMYHYGNPGQIGTSGLDDPASWTEVFNPAGRDKTKIEGEIVNYTPLRGLGSAMCFLADRTGKDEEHTDGMVASRVIDLLRAHKDEPFFIGAGFYRPHTPYVAPQSYFDLYPLEKIELPPTPGDYLKKVPELALASTRPRPWFGVTEQQARECKRAYYAAISFVDAQIGRVLGALEELGLSKNTIVVFWSDHGYHLGEHGLWMKQSCFEQSARVPLIISAPGAALDASRGKASPRTVELLDLYPTLADLAGLPQPSHLQGASLRPLLANATEKWSRPAFTEVRRPQGPGHSVRTERWRYTEWDEGRKGIELYDYASSAGETENLAGRAEFAAIQAELKALVRENWAALKAGGAAARDR